MSSQRILIVEDELSIRDMLGFALNSAGFSTDSAADARQAQLIIAERRPDLILLDWMLPGISGVELARRLKKTEATREIPIIMLTARAQEEEKIQGLDSGADDYVTKPFSTRELMARIKAVLRRANPNAGELLQVERLRLDTASHRVNVDQQTIDIGPTEFRLLAFFMAHPERVYSRNQLLDRVWGSNVYVEERTVDVHIRRLRKLLEPFSYDHLIQTVRGAGYRFSTQV